MILEANEELTPRVISMAQEKKVERIEVFFPERDDVGLHHQPDAEEGPDPHARRGADRDLPPPAAGRSADARQLAVAVREHVLQPAEVRLLAGGPAEAEHQARAEDAARREDPAPAGLLRGDQVPAQAAQEPAERRRHRSPGQPPGAVGGRAAGEPVPHRAGAHGARDQGKDVGLPGNGDRHAARPDQRQAGDGRDPRVLRVVAAVAVHGPDQPAVRDHAQAASLGARAGRSVARARRVRGPRRAPDALRPHLPDRDAGRPEHRPDLVAVVLRAHQRVRLHRVALPQGEGRPRGGLRDRHQRRRQPEVQGRRRGGGRRSGGRRRPVQEEGRGVRAPLVLPVGVGRGQLHHRPGQLAARRQRPLHPGPRRRAPCRRLRAGAARRDPVHGRVAEAARVGGRVAGAVPRERRRQPRADGLEHAAPGGAAAAGPQPVRGHGHGVHHGPRLGRRGGHAARRHGGLRGQPAHRGARGRAGLDRRRRLQQGDGRRHLPADQVQAVQPEHLHQPAPDRARGPEGGQGPGAGRRAVHRARRAGARAQRAGGVHALARLQLRGRDPGLREDGEGGLLHLHPHRGVRDRGARHQARARRRSPATSRTSRKPTSATSTTRASSASAPT